MTVNRKIASGAGFFVAAISVSVLTGWAINNIYLTSILPGFAPMNPLSAILFILGSVLIIYSHKEKPGLQFIVSVCMIIMGTAVLVGNYLGLHYSPDNFFLSSKLNGVLMPPNSAICFILLGLVFLLTSIKKSLISAAQLINLLIFTISCLALIGYLYSSVPFYQLARYKPMAVHSAFCFMLLSLGFMISNTNTGFLSVIFNWRSGGELARKILPVTILIPIFLGWLTIIAYDEHLLDVQFGTAVLVSLLIFIFSAFIWVQARLLNRSDEERRKAEWELIRARRVAEEARKVQEQFLANMSHEIRTPMNGVIGMTNLLASTELQPLQKEFNDTIKESANNLLVILNDILDFNKISSGKLIIEKIDFSINDIIKNVIMINKFKAEEKGIRLEWRFELGLHTIYKGDPVRLSQILMNLVGNAIKFTNKGYVRIRVSSLPQKNEKIILRIDVEDSGIGIKEDKLDMIFESFTQASTSTTRKFGGTGLGLSICRHLAELQEGKISVKSTFGQGSIFTVTIPYEKSSQDIIAIQEDPIPVNDNEQFKDVNILLVEDNKINQKVAVYTLSRWGARIRLAENGLQALHYLTQEKFDLILLDLQMPEMDGFETTMRIRKMNDPMSSIPIIAMTASALHSEKERCFQIGMNDYISKPFKVEDLRDKISHELMMKA